MWVIQHQWNGDSVDIRQWIKWCYESNSVYSRSDMMEVDICSRCRRLGLSKYKVLKFGICMNPRGISVVYITDYVLTQYQSKASILY